MLQVIAPKNKPLNWYLAAEEYLALVVHTFLAEGPVNSASGHGLWLFWTPPPTVICGRHQDIEAEVNLAYCHEHHIDIVRRKSGGGTVYADRGNLMISLISPSSHSETVFADYLSHVSGALRSLGYEAVTTQHNDILVDGRKVSGTACYALPTATIVHGTMLCNVDLSALEQAITPSREKLAKHAVASVRQRVANLCDLPVALGFKTDSNTTGQVDSTSDQNLHHMSSLTAPDLEKRLVSILCTGSRVLTTAEIEAVDRLWSSSYPSGDA